jgi:hypothetical protein
MKVVIIASAKVYIEYSYGFPGDFRAVHLHLVPIVAFRLFRCWDASEPLAGSLHHDPDLFQEREDRIERRAIEIESAGATGSPLLTIRSGCKHDILRASSRQEV